MTQRLGVGVIGLGRRWRRCYKPLLLALRRRYNVRAVCDEVRRRADREARRLGCDVAAGPAALLEREEVRAVLLVDRQWFGLWPVTLACRHHKPVFCAWTPGVDIDADALCRRVESSNLP